MTVVPIESASTALLHAALRYAEQGIPVFPVYGITDRGTCACNQGKLCKQPGKHPLTRNGFKEASTAKVVIQSWWRSHPEANIGLALGEAGLIAVDVDPRNDGIATLNQLEQEHGDLPPTYTVNTGGGGQHYYYRLPSDGQKYRCVVPGHGVELKTSGGYVIAPPSRHYSGARYEFEQASIREFTDAPQWVLDYALKRSRAPEYTELADPVQSILGAAFTASSWKMRSLGVDRMAVRCPWEDEHTCGEAGDTSTVVFGSGRPGGIGWFHCSHSHCLHRKQDEVWAAVPDDVKRIIRKRFELQEGWKPGNAGRGRVPLDHSSPAAISSQVNPEGPSTAFSGGEGAGASSLELDESWTTLLAYDGKGRVKNEPGNAFLILTHHPEWRGSLQLDHMKGKLTWQRQPPLGDQFGINVGDEWREQDWLCLAQWFSRDQFMRVGRDHLEHAAAKSGALNGLDPLRDYLQGITWDGVDRISHWLTTYLGAAPTDWNRLAGRKWLIAAVARGLQPGCKVDTTLILEARQGTGKSTALRILARNPDWFLDNMPDLGDKDALIAATCHWIVEFGELESFRGIALERLKRFLTQQYDQFRAPYARHMLTRPRRCVFSGSTNETEYLHDPTGNRRYWPVRVGVTDFRALERDVDQLWAEAVRAYHAGEAWHLQGSEVRLAETEQAQRTSEDPWATLLRRELEGRGQPWVTQIHAFEMVGIERGRWQQAEIRRIASALQSLEWDRRVVSGEVVWLNPRDPKSEAMYLAAWKSSGGKHGTPDKP